MNVNWVKITLLNMGIKNKLPGLKQVYYCIYNGKTHKYYNYLQR